MKDIIETGADGEPTKLFWENRWKQQQTGWDIGYPAPRICRFIDEIPQKNASILIPGCGNAYEATYLLEQGFTQITVVDISPSAIDGLKERFGNQPGITTLCDDFFKHQGQYDYILEQTFFCALPPLMRPNYVSKMATLLKPDGQLVGLLFNRHFEGGPPYGGNAIQYQALFEGIFEIIQLEPCLESIPSRANTELFIQFKKR